jgi:arylsulfatase A-like enzyme
MAKPNILFLFTDQQRADTIGGLGNPIIRTPALNRLAREGTAFLRAYTPCPVSMAARAAMLTGLPPHVTGCVDNCGFPASARSIMQVLAGAGYQTHGVGKMHFAPDFRMNWGFGTRDTSEELRHDTDYRRFLDRNGYGHVLETYGPRGEYYYLPQPSQLPAALHESSWVADRSVDFIKRRDRSRPFFMMTSFIKPHPPFENPSPWHRLYRALEMPPPFWPENCRDYHSRINTVQNRYKYFDRAGKNDLLYRTMRAAYYSAISFVDYNISRILAALEASGGMDDTLIVFSSDHGELLGDYGCVGKRCVLEASARVPLIVRWPGRVAAGRRVRSPVSLLDLFPTFAEAGGADGAPSHPEGVSLLDAARGRGRGRRVVFSQFQRRWMGHYMAADGQFKYIYSAPDRKEWLFRTGDPVRDGENLAGRRRYADAQAGLKAALRERYARAGDREAFAGADWRKYKTKPFPKNPDYGLLFQDEHALPGRIAELGGEYARPSPLKPGANSYQVILDHSA